MSNRTLNLDDRLYDYLLAHSLREPEVLRRLRQETALMPEARMQISPEQGQFMSLLIQLIGARKCLEIGTFTGYSSLCMAMAMGHQGKVVACDINDTYTAIAQRYWIESNVADKITLCLGPAYATLDRMAGQGEAGSFDFAFIDADKENYDTYYEFCLQLVRPGGLIAIDNTLWGGSVADPADHSASTVAIRHLNAKLHHDDRINLSLVPIGDGLTLAMKR